jgi:cullin 1
MVYESIKKDMATALLKKILNERMGEIIDRGVMKDGVTMFIEMGLNTLTAYEKDFEAPLLYETANFYKREAAKWITEDSCTAFMKKAEEKLFQEQQRAQAYLHPNTEPTLIKKVEAELITQYAQRLMDMEGSGLVTLLKNNQTEDLSRMYRLFKRVAFLKPMAETTRDHITKEGIAIVQSHQQRRGAQGKETALEAAKREETECLAYIDDLLKHHEKYAGIVKNQFDNDALFQNALKDAFTHIVNMSPDEESKKVKTTAELLSTYCDFLLKSDKLGDENTDQLLDGLVNLFGYLSDKDMFAEFYRRQMSRRLLTSTKENAENERSIISRLKARCGAAYTNKFEGMIKDKSISEDLRNSFNEYVQNKSVSLPFQFVPQVLTTGFWPPFKIDNLTVPPEFATCMQVFKDFYSSRTESRLLKWVHSLGSCQMTARYPKGTVEIVMSAYQACVLLMFNANDELSAGDISKALTLPMDDVKRTMLALFASKSSALLLKSGEAKTIEQEDKFKVNEEFSSQKKKITLKAVSMTEGERKQVQDTAIQDRKLAIDACIVRIMKARRVLDHQNLVAECIKQLSQHFKPDPRDIKQRITDLIAREYIERDETQSNVYKYMA